MHCSKELTFFFVFSLSLNGQVRSHGILFRLKNYQGAIALYSAAVQIDGRNAAIYKRLAETYRAVGDSENYERSMGNFIQFSNIKPYLIILILYHTYKILSIPHPPYSSPLIRGGLEGVK